jgi:hypothetical protein
MRAMRVRRSWKASNSSRRRASMGATSPPTAVSLFASAMRRSAK